MVDVRSARVRPTRRRNLRLVEAAVADHSGPMKAVWFNQAYLAERLRPGTRLLLNGKLDRSGFRVATHEIVAGGVGPASGLHTTGIVPVHNATRELSAKRLREWVWQAVERAGDAIEALPAELRARRGLGAEADALRCAHFPESPEQADAGRDQLAFEELCLNQAALAARRETRRDSRPGIAFEPAGRAGRGLARVAAVRADRRPAARVRGDRRRPRRRAADAAAADGRRRLGQDGRGRIRDAAGARERSPGGADGADRDARRAARQHAQPPARRGPARGDRVRPADRGHPRGAPPRDARPAGQRGAGADRRHPRADRARRALRRARRVHRRRAAPLRRPPARRARRQGPGRGGAARPSHDRDADPADALADRLRRPRRDHDPRAAGRTPAGEDVGGGGGEAGRRLRLHPRPPARGAPGLRRLPTGLGLREAAREGGGGRGRAAARRRTRATSGSACCTARCRRARRQPRWRRSPPATSTCWLRPP